MSILTFFPLSSRDYCARAAQNSEMVFFWNLRLILFVITSWGLGLWQHTSFISSVVYVFQHTFSVDCHIVRYIICYHFNCPSACTLYAVMMCFHEHNQLAWSNSFVLIYTAHNFVSCKYVIVHWMFINTYILVCLCFDMSSQTLSGSVHTSTNYQI